jgi:hypothetical protein
VESAKGSSLMEADVEQSSAVEIVLNMTMTKKSGRQVAITDWKIVGYSDDFAAMPPNLLNQLADVLRLMQSLKSMPTSASPQG